MGSFNMWTVCRITLSFAVMLSVACGQAPQDPAATHPIPAFEVPAARPEVTYQRFFVIGDFGTGKPDQHAVAASMAKRAEREPIDFMVTVGDNIYNFGVLSVNDPQWKTKFESVYDDESLQVPVYAALGNHDHRGSVQAQIEYTEKSNRWHMPSAYYTFTRPLGDDAAVQFFVLDTNPMQREEPSVKAQLAWLDQELEESTARWKIALGHHPLYSHSKRGHNQKLIKLLEPRFTKPRVDLYVAGHDHTLEMLRPVNGVNYVVSGAAGGVEMAYRVEWTEESHYAATRGGYVAIRVSANELVIEFIRLNAETQYAHVLTKP